MGMGFAPTWLRQVSPPPASQNHFNHCCAPGKGVYGGSKFCGSALLKPARSVCVSPSAFSIMMCVCPIYIKGYLLTCILTEREPEPIHYHCSTDWSTFLCSRKLPYPVRINESTSSQPALFHKYINVCIGAQEAGQMETSDMKKRSERRKQCSLAVVSRSQTFSTRRRPLHGIAGRPKFNQLEMVTTFTYRPSLVKIDARNFELSW